MLRSREQPDTADKHEVALKCAEALVRRNPPDLAHRAPELLRDLLYLENPFDLEVMKRLRRIENSFFFCYETRCLGPACVPAQLARPRSVMTFR